MPQMGEKTVNSESPSNLAGQRAKLGVEDELREQKEIVTAPHWRWGLKWP